VAIGAGASPRVRLAAGAPAVLLLLACASLTCSPAAPLAPASVPGAEWVSLAPAAGMGLWRSVQGSASARDGRIVVHDGQPGRSTIVARGVNLRNGAVEVHVRRAAPGEPDAPYTVSLRAGGWLNWSSIYFICRPTWLEVCRGSATCPHPRTVRAAEYEHPNGRAEQWRFVLNEGFIECFRFGERVYVYRDARPKAGTIALTADHCALEVLGVRYRPAGAGKIP